MLAQAEKAECLVFYERTMQQDRNSPPQSATATKHFLRPRHGVLASWRHGVMAMFEKNDQPAAALDKLADFPRWVS